MSWDPPDSGILALGDPPDSVKGGYTCVMGSSGQCEGGVILVS